MMKKIQICSIFLFGILFISAGGREDEASFMKRMIKSRNPYQFYNALYRTDVDLVEKFLIAGSDPNYCRGENGWVDSNPLAVVVHSYVGTYDHQNSTVKDYAEPLNDQRILTMLISYGADIQARPYIWQRVNTLSNSLIRQIREQRLLSKRSMLEDDIKLEIQCYINDSNRVLIALLNAGADPDMKGHPFPLRKENVLPMTDRRAKRYFAKGTRPINEAIKKGIMWESQVDILLRYTNLDEDSLVAAQESGDPQMIEKIQRLWEAQTTQ